MNIEELKIAVVGGDAREKILVQALIEAGGQLLLVGYPQTQGATAVDLETALKAADCVILPMSNTDPEGSVVAVPTGEKIQLSRSFEIGQTRHTVFNRNGEAESESLGSGGRAEPCGAWRIRRAGNTQCGSHS